ncbi:MAG: NAD+ synthase [Gammaproteobacteria bacterium]|nr:NAD+ synthase [Gammaproteobacteria bacterium]
MRITIAQSNFCVGDIKNNTKTIVDCIETAKQLGSDLIAFPELAITGYPPEDLLLRRALYNQVDEALLTIKSVSNDISILIGYPYQSSQSLYNSCSLIENNEIQASYHKQNLPNYGVFDEKRYFTAGDSARLINVNGIALGLSICEDIWSSGPAKQVADAGAKLLININASPFHSSKPAEREKILRQRVEETGLNIIYLNLVGGQDELVFDGGSMIVDEHGEVIFRASQFDEELYTFDIEEKNKELVFSTSTPGTAKLDYLPAVYSALVLGVKDYVGKNGFKGAVIGLSGGIDSALTLAIASDALGPENVEILIMPSRYTADMSTNDAVEMANKLQVKYSILPIEKPFQAFTELLAPVFEGLPADATEENLQARSRGVLMMALSNKTGKLVLTTGNKSEMSVGYATLYGDMAGGFAPLKDLSKTLTYELSEWRNTQTEIIPRRIIDRPPTAELRADQKDEDSLPPYSILDPILERYIELDQSPEEIVRAGFDKETVYEIVRMVDRNEYKRRQAAPGVRITKRAFGRDRRYPITSRYRES